MPTETHATSTEIRKAALVVADQIHRRKRDCFMPIFRRLKEELAIAEAREQAAHDASLDVSAFLNEFGSN